MPVLLNTVDISSTYFENVSVISTVEYILKYIEACMIFYLFFNYVDVTLRSPRITGAFFTCTRSQNPLLLIGKCKCLAVLKLSSNVLKVMQLLYTCYLLAVTVGVPVAARSKVVYGRSPPEIVGFESHRRGGA